MEESRIPLNEMRLLNINQFCQYANVCRKNAMYFINKSNSCIMNGKKILVDRVKFDQWCDEQTGVLKTPKRRKKNDTSLESLYGALY